VGRVRLLILALAVLALCAPAAPAGGAEEDAQSAAKHGKKRTKKRCGKGRAMVVLHGRGMRIVRKAPRKGRVVCLRRGKPPRSKAQARALASKLFRLRRVRPQYVKRLERRRLVRRLNPFLRRLDAVKASGAPAARAARAVDTGTEDMSGRVFQGKDVPGGKAKATTTVEAPDYDETGRYVGSDLEVGVSGKGGSANRRKGFGFGAFAQRCPDAEGMVRGVVKGKIGEGLAAKPAGAAKGVSAGFEVSWEVEVTGRVGDDGRFKDFSYRGTATTEFKGYGDDGRYIVKVYRLAFSNSGPVPRNPSEQALTRALSTSTGTGRGPKGDNLDAKELKLLNAMWSLAEGLTLIDANAQLLESEKSWYDAAECIKVDISPNGTQVKKSGSLPLDTVARSKRDNAQVNGGAMRVSTSCPGQASPTAGTSPLHLTLSDPGGQWVNGVAACVAAESVSKRGRGLGSASFPSVGDPQYFRVAAEGSANFSWSKTYHSQLSNCDTNGSGSGSRDDSYDTKSGTEAYVAVHGGTVEADGAMDVTGSFTQNGNYSETSSGTGCSGSFVGDQSDCGTKTADGSASVKTVAPGRVSLHVSGPDPFDDEFNPCPITWPQVIDASGNPTHEEASPGLVAEDSIALPMDQLRDPDRASVVVTGGGHDNATEFCSSASSNNGGQCGPEENITVTGDKSWTWKLTFTRVPPP
jgi:hypothetical protein